MISVIIPARNERSVIARALSAMTTGAKCEQLEIIVVCNGCTDDTATIAAAFGPTVRVIETEIGSKTHALNLGDRAASSFPRIYVDADVVITFDSIQRLVSRLQRGDVLAVAPLAKINLSGCSWLVRAFFDIRARLPSAQEGIGGSGVYAVSETGRRRFSDFPSLTADDGYVRVQFRPEERETIVSAVSIVFAPRTTRDLLLIRTRSYYGTFELARLYPNLWKNRGESNHKTVLRLLKHPNLWFKVLIFCYINVIARCKARARFRAHNFFWERDITSRSPLAMTSDMPGR